MPETEDKSGLEAVASRMYAAQQRRWVGRSEGDVLVDSDGRILGKVVKAIGTGYHAQLDGHEHLGTYIDSDSAKKAVERAA